MQIVARAAVLALLALALPGVALAQTSVGQPFPSNLYTTPDSSQLTGLRVDLPTPDCAARPSDCEDIAVLDTLDGFNIQPRVSVPFSGPIDLSTVSSSTIFLVGPGGHLVGINQAVWEPAANTLHFESDEQLAQDTTYLLVVSSGVHDAGGVPVTSTFRHDLNYGQTKDKATKAYRKQLLDALPMAMAGGVDPDDIAGASLFTTQSIDAISRRIRQQLSGGAANFNLGTGGERTVFPLPTVSSITWLRQTGTATFAPGNLNAVMPLLGSVGTIAFGTYPSPDYETADKVIPAVGTATGVPAVQSMSQVQFTLFVPAGTPPAGGWPVAIFGHGFGDWKNGAPPVVAGTLALNGLATIAINVVGHGGGPLGTYTINRVALPSVTLPLGGRGIDQNGNGTIDSTEGVAAVGANGLISNRDGLRQTVVDLMQLVKVLKGGVDVDGVPGADLSTTRISYAGQSFGGIYGVQLLGLEPDVRAGVTNVPGGSILEIARLSPGFRPLVGLSLLGPPFGTRNPPLYNTFPPDAAVSNFNENIPLRNQPIVVDTVPGASAIQTLIDNSEWAQQAANPAAYAPFVAPSRILLQFARGDKTVPNPTTSAILRAGGLASRATLYRNDLAFALNPAVGTNPHAFLTNVAGAGATYAFAAQQQLAAFLASDGALTIDPDGAGGPFFETPTSMVPEDLGFLP